MHDYDSKHSSQASHTVTILIQAVGMRVEADLWGGQRYGCTFLSDRRANFYLSLMYFVAEYVCLAGADESLVIGVTWVEIGKERNGL